MRVVRQARYLVERQSADLWGLALSPDSQYRSWQPQDYRRRRVQIRLRQSSDLVRVDELFVQMASILAAFFMGDSSLSICQWLQWWAKELP
eukprot:6476884-Amphidinium_carterae.1